MVGKAWKNFVNEYLTEIEDSYTNEEPDVEESFENPSSFGLDHIMNDKKSWCSTIDRSFGYAFKFFCRFVVTRTLAESSILNRFQIRPSNFNGTIDRNFCFSVAPSAAPLPKYYESYPRYARWHNWHVRSRRLFRTRRSCNLSYLRMLTTYLRPPSKRSSGAVAVEVDKYRVVKPVTQFSTPTLSAVFE
ncbi:conserved hypothetical protein [Theileria orientalis strain Shintoku]|uniref:Uncharacterized protein n=1 Tax=Theileria orientalis strain Shintoku TaxID=869250 RepID=J4C919_THEOR|nr:conserved hypothetical protein [Theileria orientalis strain Shintoku]PVC53639.1 hypothetical protein MACL_00003677 [Theileria orientalis]BAM41768.1 conserved hypothetical protein [Theileria orientalis strain Shintoku]|eukprot:XP_009692069.1 conserved hypothetical protein [Theileria orientalis strain Shintoku]